MSKTDRILAFSGSYGLLKPKSICSCGHSGDGANSQHSDLLGNGHGLCKLCACKRFAWAKWTNEFATAKEGL